MENVVQEQNNQRKFESDEIDLREVALKIWNGRWLIFGIVSICAVIAFVSIKFMTSYYRIETTIDVILPDQLRPLAPSALGSSEFQVALPDGKKIYDRVLLQANYLSLLRDFWEQETGKQLDLTPGAPVTIEAKEFRKFYDGFDLSAPNAKTPDITARKISIEHTNPTEGVRVLNKYLVYLNKQVWLDISQRMLASYEANLNALNISYEAKNLIEQRRLSDSLVSLRENLKIAESLGIKETPFRELENVQLKILDSRDYLIGTKPLSQQIDILTARQGKSLAPFSADLRALENWREQINTDMNRLKQLDGKINLFSVVNKPEATLDPVKPKKALIFIGIVVASFIFSIIFVLLRSTFSDRKH